MNSEDGHGQNNEKGNHILKQISAFIYAIIERGSEDSIRNKQTDETNKHVVNATVALARWTKGLVFVSLLTVGVLVLQYRTFEKTDQTLKSQERSFIYVDNFKYVYTSTDLMITPIWKNSGSTPALSVYMYTGERIFEDDIPNGFGFPNLEADAIDGIPEAKKQGYYFGHLYMAPQSTLAAKSIILNRNDFVAKRHSGIRKAVIYGWGCYVDVFGNRHLTRFCNYIDLSISGNYPSCDIYTCTDNDCGQQCE